MTADAVCTVCGEAGDLVRCAGGCGEPVCARSSCRRPFVGRTVAEACAYCVAAEALEEAAAYLEQAGCAIGERRVTDARNFVTDALDAIAGVYPTPLIPDLASSEPVIIAHSFDAAIEARSR